MERVDPKTKKSSYDTKVDDDANLAAGDKKSAEQHWKVEKLDKLEAVNSKAKEDDLLNQEDNEKSKAEVAAEGMKKLEPNTTKDAVKDSKVDGGATFVLENCKKIN